MRNQITFLLGAVLIVGMTGCKPAEEPAASVADAAPETSAPAAEPTAVETPAPAEAPAGEPAMDAAPAVTLPEGFTSRFHVHPEMTITSVETLNADEGAYKVTGELRASSLGVLDYFVKYFTDNGWEEDMVMEQEGNTIVSFKKDGYLEYVDSREGGIGAKITITTGKA